MSVPPPLLLRRTLPLIKLSAASYNRVKGINKKCIFNYMTDLMTDLKKKMFSTTTLDMFSEEQTDITIV